MSAADSRNPFAYMSAHRIQQSCYLCQSKDLSAVVPNISFGTDIILCSQCGLLQNEYVSDAAIEAFYKDYYRAQFPDPLPPEFIERAKAKAISQLRYIDMVLPTVAFDSALEIGAGEGELAKALTQRCGRVFATEIDPRLSDLLCAQKEIHVIDDREVGQPSFSACCDIIILSHVLEHIADPIHLLDKLSMTLRWGGFLFVELPNETEMILNTGWQGKGHLFYFTTETFKRMVSIQGSFDIIDIRTCNHSVKDYIDSNYSLVYDGDSRCNPDGTSIRAILRNANPKKTARRHIKKAYDPEQLLDEYSQRLLRMFHQNAGLKNDVDALLKHQNHMKNRYQSALEEAGEILKKVQICRKT